MKDKLDQIFDLQKQLNLRAGVDVSRMTGTQRQDWLLKFALATYQELAELTETLPYRWWHKRKSFNRNAARSEIIDLLHLVVSLCELVGMDADLTAELYLRKHRLNISRLRRRRRQL